MGRRHANVVARQRRTENLDRIILPANDRLACNGPCDDVSGELYNPPDINELSLPFAFKVLVREREWNRSLTVAARLPKRNPRNCFLGFGTNGLFLADLD